MRPRSIQGKVIAITGGAQGIGRATAAQLAQQGARVAIGDVNAAQVQQAAQDIGYGTLGLPLDVTDTVSFKLFLAATEHHLGPIDVLINNAGVMWLGAFDEEPEQATTQQLNVNIHGVMRGVKLMAPLMRARGQGHIITLASAASKLAPAGQATYAATKHAVYGYLSSVRLELLGSGVNISLIMPGTVQTRLTVGMDTGATRWITPDTVARQIVHLIQHPRFEVAYPAWIAPASAWAGILPDAVRLQLQRLTLPNQVNAKRRSTTRHAYEKTVLGRSED